MPIRLQSNFSKIFCEFPSSKFSFRMSKQRKHIKIEAATEDMPAAEVVVAPENWKTQYENILLMRRERNAPVDTMGCEKVQNSSDDPKIQRWHCLVSLMLSSQTNDKVNFAAMERLRNHGLSVKSVIEMSDKTLGDLIYPVGFWKRKVQYLKKTALILKENYDCDIPETVEELCKLPGVGPKMAHLCMNIAWKKQSGIGVDVHVHRISNRLGWTLKKEGTKNPEQTRVALESWLPEDKWTEINWLLVGFGQQLCTAQRPKCSSCLNQNICPYAISNPTNSKSNNSKSKK